MDLNGNLWDIARAAGKQAAEEGKARDIPVSWRTAKLETSWLSGYDAAVGDRFISERQLSDTRQIEQFRWCVETFTSETTDPADTQERVRRYVEESLELAQSFGMDRDTVVKIADDLVFCNRPGDYKKEIGQASMTLRLLAQSADVSVYAEEIREWERVKTKSTAEWQKRHERKTNAGL